MSEKGTVFQKGGGGTNFEQYVQAAFVITMAVGGNAPCIPQNQIEEIVLQATNKGWETDDMLAIARSEAAKHQLLIQSKHAIVFSENNKVFNEVIDAFWKDFNNSAFDKVNDRLLIIKNRLNNIEKNHIKGVLNYAKSHSSETDFISEVNRVKEKKERLDIFRKVLKKANKNEAISEKDLWLFLKTVDVLGYDFLDEGSVDESYFLNLIKLSKSSTNSIEEKDVWNSIITFITKNNPLGASLTKETIKEKEFFKNFDVSRLGPAYKAVDKLLKDSEAILKPIKNTIGISNNEFHIPRPTLFDTTLSATSESDFIIVTGKPGIGKSAIVKDLLQEGYPNTNVIVFRADQFNKPHLSNVLSHSGIQQSLPEIFSCFSLIPEKIIFIDSLEKLLEDADPDNAFKQLLSLLKEKKIKIIATCRKYAIQLLIQKYGLEQNSLKTIEVPALNDLELNEVLNRFPSLNTALKNEKIKALLQSPKYLDFSIRSLVLSQDDFTGISVTEFKDKLWNSLVRNATHRADGLPAKREDAFLNIAVNRAKAMKLFIKPIDVDEAAIDLLENDDIIFQDGTKRRYSPSHDILEDWALVKYVSGKYDEFSDIKTFFNEIGHQPAIRRAFRLWVEDYMIDEIDKIHSVVKSSLKDSTIERYWADEILVAIFKSDNCKTFFILFKKELLENNAVFLNRCLHLIKTACKENNYSATDTSILLPIGSGWEEAMIFIRDHISVLNHLRPSIVNFLDQWEYRLIFQYPKDNPELFAAKDIVLFYIKQIQATHVFWMERSSESYQKTLVHILYNLPSIAIQEITELVKKALKEDERRGNWKLHSFYKIILKNFLTGLSTQRISLILPDLIIESAWKNWKYIPPKLDKAHTNSIRYMLGDYLSRGQCWGIVEKFSFFPSGSYKTPVYNLLIFHPDKALKFITEFINYSVDFYVNAKCEFKHDFAEINITLNDGSVIKQWAGWELWVAYRGLSVTDYLLECLLISLEKYLLELAALKTEDSRKKLKLYYNYLLRNSNSVMITGLLTSVSIAYPSEVGEEMLPLVSIKEMYGWEANRPLDEHSSLAPYDDEISFAQNTRWESNNLPHRTKYMRGFADFLVDYQLTIGHLNPQIKDILDKMWADAKPDDIIWRKKLTEIDTRKWQVNEYEEGLDRFTIQPKYESEISEFMNTGKEKMDAANKASGYSIKLTAVYEGKEQLDFETWKEYYVYYSALKKVDTLHDRPITFAYIGLREFTQYLSDEELSYCIKTLSTNIGYIIGDTRSRNFHLDRHYNYMEKEIALESFHLLFNVVTEEDNIKELLFMMLFTMIAPFPEHELKKLIQYVRETFINTHPTVFKKIWTGVIQYSQYIKQNPYFYDDHDTQRLENAKTKEFEFVENISKDNQLEVLDIDNISFNTSQVHLLSIAFCITPYNINDKDYEQFIFRMIELIAEDFNKDEDSYKRKEDRELHYTHIFEIQKYLGELLLYSLDSDFSKKLIDVLTTKVYNITKANIYRKGDFIQFVSKTFDMLIYKLDDFMYKDENKSIMKNRIDNFWGLWNHLYGIVIKSKKEYFHSVLLFDTEYEWSTDRDDFEAFKGRKNQFKTMTFQLGKTNLKSVIKILSTIGEKEFLPEGLSWVSELIKKYPSQIAAVNTVSCERLMKRLYYNHITTIKNDQGLISDFIWLLDKMVDFGNSSAYLFRENVISYKKYG